MESISGQADGRRVALITGAARGMGRAIAERLGRDGLSVILCDINADGVEASATELRATGIDATAMVADVFHEAAVIALFAAIENKFGRLDVLVNNAGAVPRVNGKIPTIEETPLDVWNLAIAGNLTSPFLMSRSAIPLLKRSPCGRVVHIASLVAQAYSDQASYYAASKAGLLGFSRILSGELGPHKVTVNAIAPGMVNTPAIANAPNAQARFDSYAATTVIGRVGEMNDVAAAVSFLVSEEAGFITGEILNLNGGAFMP